MLQVFLSIYFIIIYLKCFYFRKLILYEKETQNNRRNSNIDGRIKNLQNNAKLSTCKRANEEKELIKIKYRNDPYKKANEIKEVNNF